MLAWRNGESAINIAVSKLLKVCTSANKHTIIEIVKESSSSQALKSKIETCIQNLTSNATKVIYENCYDNVHEGVEKLLYLSNKTWEKVDVLEEDVSTLVYVKFAVTPRLDEIFDTKRLNAALSKSQNTIIIVCRKGNVNPLANPKETIQKNAITVDANYEVADVLLNVTGKDVDVTKASNAAAVKMLKAL